MSRSSLRSFDGTEVVEARVARPERYRDLHRLATTQREQGTIARGAGLSYCASSMGRESLSIDMTRFDRIKSFDADTGRVVVEPGITVGNLLAFLISRGRFLPVLPGYPDITVGGCIAFDVHGKSQYHAGNFSAWVEGITLFHPSYGSLACAAASESEAFDLTMGGCGLTGIVTDATLRTAPLEGASIRIERVFVDDLLHAADVLQRSADRVACLYSWHDLNRRGRDFGAGVVYLETFSDVEVRLPKSSPLRPIRARRHFGYWNRASASLAMRAYGILQKQSAVAHRDLRSASFPIYGLEGYFAAFGRRGFREYQVVVPFGGWPAFVEALQSLLVRFKLPATLASLKLFRGARRNLCFSDSGVCFALDVPEGPAAVALFEEMDALALRCGATVNLSKDSRLTARACERLFPQYEAFRGRLRRYDPDRLFRSSLRERLDV